jgi:hypothetical protein
MIFTFYLKIRSSKVSNMQQTLTITVDRKKIDSKWKKELQSKIIKSSPQLKFDSNAIVKTHYGKVELLIGNPRTFANDIANWILKQRHLVKIKSFSVKKTSNEPDHITRKKQIEPDNESLPDQSQKNKKRKARGRSAWPVKK